MFRLWLFILQLLVIALAFTFVMRGLVPYPLDVVLGFVGAFLLIYAISAFREAAAISKDLRLVRRATSGATPRDGERIAINGKLRPHGLPLRAPFSRRECVYYRYAAATEAKQAGRREPLVGEYTGLAMTRCLVRDPVREIRLVGAPMFEGFESHTVMMSGAECLEHAERYVAETRFEILSFGDTGAIGRSAHMMFDDRDGQVRRDARLESAGPIGEMSLLETIVPVDADVCAVGTWSTSQAGLIQKLGTRELLTLHAGGAEGATTRLSRAVKRCLLGGALSSGIASLLILWRVAAGW